MAKSRTVVELDTRALAIKENDEDENYLTKNFSQSAYDVNLRQNETNWRNFFIMALDT